MSIQTDFNTAGPYLDLEPDTISEGGVVVVRLQNIDASQVSGFDVDGGQIEYETDAKTGKLLPDSSGVAGRWDTTGLRPSSYRVTALGPSVPVNGDIVVTPRPLSRSDVHPVTMGRASVDPTSDQILWTIIRNRTNAIAFDRYAAFMNGIMNQATQLYGGSTIPIKTPFTDAAAYNVLKVATERFLMHEAGVIDSDLVIAELERTDGDSGERARVALQEESRRTGRPVSAGDLERLRNDYYEDLGNNGGRENVALPYMNLIRRKLSDLQIKNGDELASSLSYGISYNRITGPLAMEYIWSYWIEESGMVQAISAISSRFQNRRVSGHQQLSRLDLDPLRPMSNLVWGYVQDEQHRLTVVRRAYEYAHQYGLALEGKAIPKLDVADNRARFIPSFHNLLNRCAGFYPQDDDTTVIADGFPVLNALREVHMILAEGAHNQFGDLVSTARVEMMMQQWLLARPEMREFLGGRVMVPYAEPWMDRVDTIRSMMGFSPASVTHFRDLAVYGEQILIPIRYGNWSSVNDAANAANWARYWRPEIQRYIHAYQATTGVDLTTGVDDQPPSRLLQERAAAAR